MPIKPRKESPRRIDAALYLVLVLVMSFFTYFYRYNFPPYPFWDEPYHIAAAQKYLSGVFFMEPHPPLGKLLIALGEKITSSNTPEKNAAFITTDYARGLGEGYSFTGYRLFPSLLAWLTAPLLFLIFLWFTSEPALAALFSFLYIFDNAEIVHSRGAMVDSPATFLGVLLILLFLHLQNGKSKRLLPLTGLSLLSGAAFGAIMATKVVGLIFILFCPLVVYRLFPNWKKIGLYILSFVVGCLVTYVGIWQTHFAIGNRIVPELHTNGYYTASEDFKTILRSGGNRSVKNFPLMLTDSIKYMDQYERGVPRLDLCKPDENGSPSLLWPLGGRTINYRWQKEGDDVRYLYLQSNPIAWLCGIVGVLLSAFLLLSRVLNVGSEKLQHGFFLLTFFGLYAGYMIAISSIPRVMYLYHYFLPLLFSYILFCLSLLNIRRIWNWRVTESSRVIFLTFIGLLVFLSFQLYRPLSYYTPISKSSFERLAINPLWELTCVGCEKESSFVIPVERSSR